MKRLNECCVREVSVVHLTNNCVKLDNYDMSWPSVDLVKLKIETEINIRTVLLCPHYI